MVLFYQLNKPQKSLNVYSKLLFLKYLAYSLQSFNFKNYIFSIGFISSTLNLLNVRDAYQARIPFLNVGGMKIIFIKYVIQHIREIKNVPIDLFHSNEMNQVKHVIFGFVYYTNKKSTIINVFRFNINYLIIIKKNNFLLFS